MNKNISQNVNVYFLIMAYKINNKQPKNILVVHLDTLIQTHLHVLHAEQ